MEGMIGLEIHVYPHTREKMFCRCVASREKGLKANTHICPICTGQPGAKPMLPNQTAVEKAVEVALMLKCKVNERLVWQRKHYNWPDLPKGYQTTLSGPYAFPIGVGGKFFGIGISSMHLEEDPAAWDPETGRVDYNRSGLPLLEIITDPDFSTAEEVMTWLKGLIHNLRYLKAVQGDAGIKVDVNVNLVNRKFTSPSTSGKRASARNSKEEVAGMPGKITERVEVKNVNSIAAIGEVIEYELDRQAEEGGKKQETRRWDAGEGGTVVMREKESADDYRFISDPDLADVFLDSTFVNELEKGLPESPEAKLEKLVKKYKIGKVEAGVLAKNLEIVEFFERVADKVGAKFALDWVIIELLSVLNYRKVKLEDINISLDHFVELLDLIKRGGITISQGREILRKFYPKSFSVGEKKIAGRMDSEEELVKIVKRVIDNEKDAARKYKAGDKKVLNYLIGKVMGETKGRADFKVVRELIERELG